jgi:hypothetical protein
MEEGVKRSMWYKSTAQAKGKILSYSRKTGDVVWKECWEVKSQHENKISVVKMGILHWMCGKTRHDRIIIEKCCWKLGLGGLDV